MEFGRLTPPPEYGLPPNSGPPLPPNSGPLPGERPRPRRRGRRARQKAEAKKKARRTGSCRRGEDSCTGSRAGRHPRAVSPAPCARTRDSRKSVKKNRRYHNDADVYARFMERLPHCAPTPQVSEPNLVSGAHMEFPRSSAIAYQTPAQVLEWADTPQTTTSSDAWCVRGECVLSDYTSLGSEKIHRNNFRVSLPRCRAVRCEDRGMFVR